MSFRSREKQSYLKRSVQLRSSLQLLLQVQPVDQAHKFVNISWRESSTGLVNDKSRLRVNMFTRNSCSWCPYVAGCQFRQYWVSTAVDFPVTAVTLHLRLKINRN